MVTDKAPCTERRQVPELHVTAFPSFCPLLQIKGRLLVLLRLLKAALPALHVSSISVQKGCLVVYILMGSLFVLNLAHEQREGGAADISPRASRAFQRLRT